MPFPSILKYISSSPYFNGDLSINLFEPIRKIDSSQYGETLLVYWLEKKDLAPQSMFARGNNVVFKRVKVISPIHQSEEMDVPVLLNERLFVLKTEKKSSTTTNEFVQNRIPALETKILQSLAHPFITAYVGHFEDDSNHYLVQEYVGGSDLKSLINERAIQHNAEAFLEKKALKIIFQLALALEYLHRHNICHQNLKAKSLQIGLNNFIKLRDFGLPKEIHDVLPHSNHSISDTDSLSYMSPQVVLRQSYDDKADCWSVGVLLYEMLTLQKPFVGESTGEITNKILTSTNCFRGAKWKKLPEDLQRIISGLLQKEVDNRLSMKALLNLPKMRNIGREFIQEYDHFARVYGNPIDKTWAKLLYEQHQQVLATPNITSKAYAALTRVARKSIVENRYVFFNEEAQSRETISKQRQAFDENVSMSIKERKTHSMVSVFEQ